VGKRIREDYKGPSQKSMVSKKKRRTKIQTLKGWLTKKKKKSSGAGGKRQKWGLAFKKGGGKWNSALHRNKVGGKRRPV